MNDRLQAQEFDKSLIGAEAVCGSKQHTDYKDQDRWSVYGSSLFSSNTLPSHQNITAAGCLPCQQPSDNVWTDRFQSAWKNDVPGVVLPWWNGNNDKWITPFEKVLSEPASSVGWQHLMKCIKVSMVTGLIH